MPLPAGARLGPYELLGPIGAGGMGEVYRAKDTRLGREVAVKVLPQHLSASPEIRARFEREAKTVSALNHPQICTLFDVGREGEIDYLVMELIEGESLATRLERGPLGATELLKVGAQIADALDRAHRAGVVHRDLKPGNVMLTKSGAKLMDFGLARNVGIAGSSSGSRTELAASPTQAQPLTTEGTILGTYQYMAPEQLEGAETDARADIWALGCVLYEMATARRAFEGRSQASLISSIMSSEPVPLVQVAPTAPPGLDRVVKNCLTKDPEERTRTAHDVKLQLQGLAEGGSVYSGSAVAVPRAKSPRLAWGVAITATLIALGTAAWGWHLRGASQQEQHAKYLFLDPPKGSNFGAAWSSSALSPDGTMIAFAAARDGSKPRVWVQRLDSETATPLTDETGALSVFWSPDSRTIGYTSESESALKTIPVGGGTPTVLCRTRGARGATWNQHGEILFAKTLDGPLFKVSQTGGDPIQVTTLDVTRNESGHRFPYFLPDGDHFLYSAIPGRPEGWDLYVGSLSDKRVKKVTTASSAASYAAPGYLLFARGGKVMAQRFDLASLTVEGEPTPIGDAPARMNSIIAESLVSASSDNTLSYRTGEPREKLLRWVDQNGSAEGLVSLSAGDWGNVALSPDDRWAAVANGARLVRIDLARAVVNRVADGEVEIRTPVWSPDGTKIAYTASGNGADRVMVANADGSGEPREWPTPSQFKNCDQWSKEGLIFNIVSSTSGSNIWLSRPGQEANPEQLTASKTQDHSAKVSPDGRSLAYLSIESEVTSAFIQSYPKPGNRVRLTQEEVGAVWWMPGGDEIRYYSPPSTSVMKVRLTRRGDDLEVGAPQLVTKLPLAMISGSASSNGLRILAVTPSQNEPRRSIRVILNWTTLLEH